MYGEPRLPRLMNIQAAVWEGRPWNDDEGPFLI